MKTRSYVLEAIRGELNRKVAGAFEVLRCIDR